MEPLIHGGKSTTKYRSGTPALPLIVSMAKALRLIDEELDTNYQHTLELNQYLKEQVKNINQIKINSNEKAIPHILNISVMGIKARNYATCFRRIRISIFLHKVLVLSNNPISRSV